MDRALRDRFLTIEMEPLDKLNERQLLDQLFPDVDDKFIEAVVDITCTTRIWIKSDTPEISTIISTRATKELCKLGRDGFTLNEAAEVVIYPLYPDDGGKDSERVKIKQLVQKWTTPKGMTTDLYDDPAKWEIDMNNLPF